MVWPSVGFFYTGKINENHTFIKRKQGEHFWGHANIYRYFFGMADIPDIFGGMADTSYIYLG